jgi:hypothetical protein
MNKQTIRWLNKPLARVSIDNDAINSGVVELGDDYAYADSAEHREGIGAFLAKRKPAF